MQCKAGHILKIYYFGFVVETSLEKPDSSFKIHLRSLVFDTYNVLCACHFNHLWILSMWHLITSNC